MADTFQVMSGLSAVLKEAWSMFSDVIATDELIVGYRRVKENVSANWDGDQNKIWVPFQTKLNRQAGPVAESAARKAAGKSTFSRAYFNPHMQDGVFGVAQRVIEQAKSDAASAINVLKQEIKNVKLAVEKELAQQYHADGSGSYGFMPAVDSDATFSVAAPFFGEVGDVINILDFGDGTTFHSTNDDAITAIGDPVWADGLPTQVVTITDTPTSTGVGDFVVRSLAADGTASAIASTFADDGWDGLAAIVSDANPRKANYGGLDRTAAATLKWQAQVATGSSSSAFPFINTTYFRSLSNGIMESLYNTQKRRGGKLDYILCSDAMVQEYIAMNEVTTNRTPGIVKSVDSAFEGPAFHGKPLVGDPYCLPCRMYFIDESAIGKKTVWPLKPFPNEQQALQPDLSKTYAFTYAVNTCGNFVSGTPWKLGLLADVSEGVHVRLNG